MLKQAIASILQTVIESRSKGSSTRAQVDGPNEHVEASNIQGVRSWIN